MAERRRSLGNVEVRQGSIRLRVSVKDPTTGRRRQERRTIHGTFSEREQHRLLADFYAEVQRTGPAPREKRTVADAVAKVLEQAEARVEPHTLREMKRNVRNHVLPRIGARPLAELTGEPIDDLYTELALSGGLCRRRNPCPARTCEHGGGDPLAPASVRKIHNLLVQAFDLAIRYRWVREGWANPARLATPPTVHSRKPRKAPLAQVRTVIEEAAKAPWLFAFLALSSTAGSRRSETGAPLWCDLDLAARVDGDGRVWGEWHVRRKLVAYPGGARLVESTKTEASEATILLDPVVVSILLDYRTHQEKEAAALGRQVTERSCVFTPFPGSQRPFHPSSISRDVRRLRAAAGADEAVLRNFRHLVGTEVVREFGTAAGRDRLRHSHGGTTTRFYVAGDEDDDAAAAAHMSRRVLGGIVDARAGETA